MIDMSGCPCAQPYARLGACSPLSITISRNSFRYYKTSYVTRLATISSHMRTYYDALHAYMKTQTPQSTLTCIESSSALVQLLCQLPLHILPYRDRRRIVCDTSEPLLSVLSLLAALYSAHACTGGNRLVYTVETGPLWVRASVASLHTLPISTSLLPIPKA